MNNFVAVLMGSDSDFQTMKATCGVLKHFDVHFEVKVTSAHRTPVQTKEYVVDAEQRGCKVFICAAGLAAHLAGAVASMTVLPVIGVPIANGPLQGEDALLSTVMMPGGIPVATVAIGSAGAKNAGYLATQMLAIDNVVLKEKLLEERRLNIKTIEDKNASLQTQLLNEF